MREIRGFRRRRGVSFAVLIALCAALLVMPGASWAAELDVAGTLTTPGSSGLLPEANPAEANQSTSDAQNAASGSVVPVFSGLPSETSMTEDLTSFFYYSDSLFANDAATYNDDLAYASANLAAAADNSNTGGSDYASKACNIKQFLTDIGCTDVTANDGYNFKPAEKSNIGVAIGHKAIHVNGQDYRLFVFGVRGGGYEREWAANMKIGTSGDHQGFQEARDAALAFILPYIQSHTNSGEHVKVWASGYCRGGVVANMTCAWLDKWIYERNTNSYYKEYNDSYCSDHSVLGGGTYDKDAMAFKERVEFPTTYLESNITLSQNDVYCYPVNNPQASSKSDVEAHKDLTVGIHNLINPDD